MTVSELVSDWASAGIQGVSPAAVSKFQCAVAGLLVLRRGAAKECYDLFARECIAKDRKVVHAAMDAQSLRLAADPELVQVDRQCQLVVTFQEVAGRRPTPV